MKKYNASDIAVVFALLYHGLHVLTSQKHIKHSLPCLAVDITRLVLFSWYAEHFMLNYVGNIKCVNNKTAIHISNAKLVYAAIEINRERKA